MVGQPARQACILDADPRLDIPTERGGREVRGPDVGHVPVGDNELGVDAGPERCPPLKGVRQVVQARPRNSARAVFTGPSCRNAPRSSGLATAFRWLSQSWETAECISRPTSGSEIALGFWGK